SEDSLANYGLHDEINLQIDDLDDVNLRAGSFFEKEIRIKNSGLAFLTNCNFVFEGEVKSWFSTYGSKSIGVDEEKVFIVRISAPENVEEGGYISKLTFRCDEGKLERDLRVKVSKNDFKGKISEYEFTDNELKIYYFLAEVGGRDHEIRMSYHLFGTERNEILKGEGNVVLGAGDSKVFVLEIPIEKKDITDRHLELILSDENNLVKLEKEIVFPRNLMTSRTIFVPDSFNFYISGFVLLTLLILFLVTKKIFNLYSETKVVDFDFNHKRRKLIDLRI
ncbi:MAG: hypothetical protein AABY10_01490, partial [Nanoarchaeota archaeon]